MDIKKFLKENDVQEALQRNDLLEVYNLMQRPIEHFELTEYLIKHQINPLDYLTVVPSAAFRCVDIETIHIPSTVERISTSAFSECIGLSEITFEEGITCIGRYAFSSCRSLTEIVLPDSLTTIEEYAFEKCRKLEYITIPENVVYIGTDILYGCPNATIICKKNSKAHRYALNNKLKFKFDDEILTESLDNNIDTLIEDVQDIADEHKRIINDIRKLFIQQDFEEEEKLNGIAFTQELNKPVNLLAQFYIDTTDMSHSCYIKSEDASFDSSYANKGNIDSLEKSAALFVNEFIQITTADVI